MTLYSLPLFVLTADDHSKQLEGYIILAALCTMMLINLIYVFKLVFLMIKKKISISRQKKVLIKPASKYELKELKKEVINVKE